MNPRDLNQSRSARQPKSMNSSRPSSQTSAQHQAAANMIRGQLDNIYQGGSGEQTPHTTPVQTAQVPLKQESVSDFSTMQTNIPQDHGLKTAPAEISESQPDPAPTSDQPSSIYNRTMSESSVSTQPASAENQWQQYHEAWQKYYQIYYERHYMNQVAAQKLQSNTNETTDKLSESNDDGFISPKAAMSELRQTIRQKVSSSAEQVKKSRHFKPVAAGLVVLSIFAFLQWNGTVFSYIAAYASPGNADPQNIIASPNSDINVPPEQKMSIPKINLDAPVIYGIGPDYNSQMTAMEKGIAHFAISGANAVPGQVGNAVFAAHSSNDIFAAGEYKNIFARNEMLTKGDIIYMNYEGKRYTYSVTSTEVVMPNEVSKVQIQTDKPMLTLISCVPLGTAQKRLLVFAEQVSPDPSRAATANTDVAPSPDNVDIPGRPAPTLLERLFGAS